MIKSFEQPAVIGDLDDLVDGIRDRFTAPEPPEPDPPARKTRRRKPAAKADRHDGVPSNSLVLPL
ncbi:hypothetical protein ACIBF1_06960 [Spirillospora sp. NPDC050679]